jgi:virginiamycin A acetyltransferase
VSAREAAKACARALATIAVSPALLSYAIKAAVLGPNRALEGSSQTLSMIPGAVGQYLRCAFLRRVLESCHPTATVEFGVLFSQVGTRLDENVYIGPRCHIGLAHLEADVLLGAGVHVPSGAQTHGTADPDTPIRLQEGTRTLVRIGAGSWVGSGAIIMANVGPECIIGAGSVVTRDVPARVLAAGVPARVIRSRTPEAAAQTGAAGTAQTDPNQTDPVQTDAVRSSQ